MNQGQKYNFIKIVEEKSLLIPQIQRDYVQHRPSYKVEQSRGQLLESLTKVVKGEKENINLNFVYGYSDFIFSESSNNGLLKRYDCFVPIDGQQRLTTLFLLHLFVYAKAEKDVSRFENKLFYQTRETTKNFINKLTENISNLIDSDNICNAVKNSNWYSSAWEFDVSVKSCLKVLEGIQEKFNGFNDWGNAKSNLNNIGFMLLNITELGKPNELYIKMNSRGRQLTPFENFKSDLYGYLDKNFKDSPDFVSNFKKGLDNDWQENIWNWFKNDELKEQYTDALTKELIHWIIVNRKIIEHKPEKGDIDINALNLPLEETEKSKDCYMIYPTSATPEKYWFSSYEIKGNKETEDIYYTFNLFSKLENQRKLLFDTIIGTINEKSKLNKNLNQYPARIRLLAITLFAEKISSDAPNENNFKEWYRITNNILNHSEIDTIERFSKACKAMYDLAENYTCNLLDSLKNLYKCFELNNFSNEDLYKTLKSFPNIKEEQIKEECYKATLLDDPAWCECITNAESHDYFKGEIYFALHNIKTSTDFDDRWKQISDIFNDSQNDILLKKYFIKNQIVNVFPYSISEKYCLYYWNDKHHNNDWRGFLRKEEGRKAFYNFLTEYINSGKTLKKFVKKASDLTSANAEIRDNFKDSLLNNDEMLSYMGYGRYMCENGHCYLLKSDDRSRGIDYKLYEAYIELTKKKNYSDIVLPEFTSKDDMSNISLNVSGKKITFNNNSFAIDDVPLNCADVKALINKF